MTVPRAFRSVSEMVRSILPQRLITLAPYEESVGTHLRGNTPLYEALVGFLKARIDLRASQPVPADPTACRASMERDHELRILLNRLETIYHSPAASTQDNGEPPA